MLVIPFPGILIRWDGDQQVEIFVSDALSNRLCGLCGQFDGNANNEFVTPAGDSVSCTIFSFWSINCLCKCTTFLFEFGEMVYKITFLK